MSEYNKSPEDVQGNRSILVDILINEAVKLLTDAEFGHLPTTYVVASLFNDAAKMAGTWSLDFIAPEDELDEARKRITTFTVSEGYTPTAAQECELAWEDAIFDYEAKQRSANLPIHSQCVLAWENAAAEYEGRKPDPEWLVLGRRVVTLAQPSLDRPSWQRGH